MFNESLEVVYKNLIIWRIYLSDEGTLQLLMNYLFVFVRIYSNDDYLPAVEGSENVLKTKRCTEESRPSQVAKIFSYFQESSVMDSCMVAYHREQRPLFLVLFDSMSFTYAIARLRVRIEKETHACDVPVV